MVHYVRIARCPYCNALTDYSNTTREQLIGNPKRVCRKCKQYYYDFAYQEDAIYFYQNNIKPSIITSSILKLLNAAPKVSQKQKIDKYFEEELNKDSGISSSLRRLSNPVYLEFLTDNYIEVPPYFFDRIGYVPDISPAEKIKMREKQEKDDLDALKKEQEKFITASHYLKLGTRNAAFKAVAQKVGMTPDEFKKYCQNVIVNYENIHRDYNRTHRMPAQFPEVP